MSTKEQLNHARMLIKAKKYDEARSILVNIEHPIAEQWLAKLDTIAPTVNRSKPKSTKPVAETAPVNTLPAGEPWPPRPIGGRRIKVIPNPVALPFWGIKLALNWRRLGRPSWMWDTLLVYGLLLVTLIVSIFIFVKIAVDVSLIGYITPLFFFSIMICGFNAALPLSLYYRNYSGGHKRLSK